MIYKLIKLIVVAFLVSSCNKTAPELVNPNQATKLEKPSEIFLSFWNGMNNSYAFWDIDKTDWDAVYNEYLPKFQALDAMTEIKSKDIETLYKKLSKNLIDHHLYIGIANKRAPKGDNILVEIQPGDAEVMSRKYYHEKIKYSDIGDAISENTTNNRIKYGVSGSSKYGDDKFMGAISYMIDDGIVYLYLSDFAISQVISFSKDPYNEAVVKVIENYQSMILGLDNLKGVIIDVRGNPGGSLNDMEYVVGPMISEKLHIGYTKSKNGLGRYDYEPWMPAILPPAEKHRKITEPVVVLADLQSISMAEMTALAVKQLPKGYVVGERTFGGTGPLFGAFDFSFAGTFKNNAVEVYTSTSILKTVDDKIIEGVGVTPDVEALYDPVKFSQQIDSQLEVAVDLIKKNSTVK